MSIQDAWNSIEQFFEGQGYSTPAAQGITAGLYSESGLNPTALGPVIPSTGHQAYGLAQELGPRQTALFNEYGSTPTQNQQLTFIAGELQSGNGGSTIASQTTAAGALSSFINLFERPGDAGAASDISRGTTALNTYGNASVSNGQDLGNTGNGGVLGSIWGGVQTEWNNFQTGASFLQNNGVVAGAAVMAGATASQATSNPGGALGGQLFGPLIEWFNSQEAGFEAAIPSAVERWSIGIVAVLLIAAGIFFLASQNKTIVQAVQSGALAAA